jgi:tetratricopeptide (TPR) repeat protein
MNTPARRLQMTLALMLLVGALSSPASAQGPLADVRALYAAAAYEDALSALGKLDASSRDRGEAAQYRAFCLVALGRTADAERAIESVVSADPFFVPPAADVSPRILAMFADVRRRLLPEMARRAYLEGRSAFQAKAFPDAARLFDQAMRMIDQASNEGVAEMDDLRVLVSGFVDLSRAAIEPPATPAATHRQSATPPPAPEAPAATAEAFTAPIVVRQELPRWNPLTPAMAEGTYAGAIRVFIGADGRVEDAEMVKSVHPLYDPLVLQAAREWIYRPALRLGQPTAAEKVVEIRLTPR